MTDREGKGEGMVQRVVVVYRNVPECSPLGTIRIIPGSENIQERS